MASVTTILGLIDLSTGESSYGGFGNWGAVADENFRILEKAIGDVVSKTVTTLDVTLTTDEARAAIVKLTGTLTGNREVITPDVKGFWIVRNDTDGAFTITFKTATGAGVEVRQGAGALLFSDGADMIEAASIADAVNLAAGINDATEKETIHNDDVFAGTDSEAAGILARWKWSTIKATLETYFDSLSTTLSNKKLVDGSTTIVGSSDATKAVKFEVDGLTTETTRTITVPDKNGTMAMTSDVPSLPVGAGMDFWGTSAPSGWLLCYGQAISRSTYSALFAVIGTTYGTGDGSTTFNLPDKRGRVSAGKDDMGGSSANRLTNQTGGLNGDTLGATGGAETHALTAAQIPDNAVDNNRGVGSNNTPTTEHTGTGDAHNNVQPTIIANYIIYAGV